MPDFPFGGASKIETIGTVSASSRGTELICPAGTHTKGSWIELSASTPYDAVEIIVMMGRIESSDERFLVDIAIGTGGSEEIIIENMMCMSPDGKAPLSNMYSYRLAIPAGTRVAGRAQSSESNDQVDISILLIPPSFVTMSPLARVETSGVNEADSGGTAVDAGGSSHTKGAWVQMVASTAFDYHELNIMISSGGNVATSSSDFLMDVAIGDSSSEEVVCGNFYFGSGGSYDAPVPCWYCRVPVFIPQGSRIAIRTQSDITDSTDRVFDFAIQGIG